MKMNYIICVIVIILALVTGLATVNSQIPQNIPDMVPSFNDLSEMEVKALLDSVNIQESTTIDSSKPADADTVDHSPSPRNQIITRQSNIMQEQLLDTKKKPQESYEDLLQDQIIPEVNKIEVTDKTDDRFYRGEDRWKDFDYFGYSIFNNELKQSGPIEIGPVDPGYPLGAGDVVRLSLWGEVEFQYELEVTRDGTIMIPNVGQVFIAGTRLEDLRETLHNYLSKFYSGLRENPPSIFLDITLARLRQNQIYIMGDVSMPGAYAVSSYATAFNALYSVGGPTITGSMRDVRILRSGSVIASIDLYDYLLRGVSTDDMRLQHNDIVFVPPRLSTVGITGEINRPAIYELLDGETAADLISFAGGLKPTAYSHRGQIDRLLPIRIRTRGEDERQVLDIDISGIATNVPIVDGDILTVFPIVNEMENYVTIEGDGIRRPGRYELSNGITTVNDLIETADGVTDDVFREKADLVRTDEDLTKYYISLDLENILANDTAANISLQKRDIITLYARSGVVDSLTITLEGFVREEGTFDYYQNMSVRDLLYARSGFQDSLRYSQTYLERGNISRLSDDGRGRYNIPFNVEHVWRNATGSDVELEPYDIVTIYENAVVDMGINTVSINGAVKEPGQQTWKDNLTLKDLILSGRGFAPGALLTNAEVARFPESGIQGDSTAIIIAVPLADSQLVVTAANLSEASKLVLSDTGMASNFLLKPGDHVFIRSNPDFETTRVVNLEGEVINPGNHVLLKENETLSELIHRTGGLKRNAFIEGGQIWRDGERVFVDFYDILVNKSKREDIILQSGDNIIIPSPPNTVYVQGEVMNEGYYKYLSGKHAKDYISMAGGKTEDADRAVLLEPSGRAKNIGFMKNPIVLDGSVISVYTKKPEEEQEKINWTEKLQDSFSVLSSAIMIVYLSQQINK